MPLMQGGPPQWLWERTPDPLKWEVRPLTDPAGKIGYLLQVQCGLEIMRLQFFSREEIKELASLIEVEVP